VFDPDDAEAHYRLGNVLAEQERLEEALAEYETSIRLRPRAAAVHMRLAAILSGLGRTAEADAHYCEALQLDPDAEALPRGAALPSSRPALDASLASFKGRCPLGPGTRGHQTPPGGSLYAHRSPSGS